MPEFRVHAHHDAGHRPRLGETEAAALAYVEDWPHTIDDDPEVRVIVRDLESGHEHCFCIDLDTGGTADCARLRTRSPRGPLKQLHRSESRRHGVPPLAGHPALARHLPGQPLPAATNPAGDVHFNLINPKTNNRIKMITTDRNRADQPRDLVKGYEVSRANTSCSPTRRSGRSSWRARGPSRSAPCRRRDRPHPPGQPYYLAPDGRWRRPSRHPRAIAKAGKIASAHRHLHPRAHPGPGAARQGHPHHRSTRRRGPQAHEIFGGIAAAKPDADMVAIALKIIEQRASRSTLAVRRPLRGGAEGADRPEEEGHKPVAAESRRTRTSLT
jgi:DNA end-binding protein Ku